MAFASAGGKALTPEREYRTHDEARTDIFRYIEMFYNRNGLIQESGTRPRKAIIAKATSINLSPGIPGKVMLRLCTESGPWA